MSAYQPAIRPDALFNVESDTERDERIADAINNALRVGFRDDTVKAVTVKASDCQCTQEQFSAVVVASFAQHWTLDRGVHDGVAFVKPVNATLKRPARRQDGAKGFDGLDPDRTLG